MTTTVFLVRHAVHDRVDRVLCGRMPGVGLGASGRTQAERLAERFGREPVAALYTSPVQRARETAAPIAERLGLDARPCEAFEEIDLGEWTGRSFDALHDDPRWTAWNTARGVTRAPGGETMLEVKARAVGALLRLRDRHPDESIAVVSHADVIKAVLLFCLGLPLDAYLRIEVAPASVSTVAIGDWGAKLLTLNEAVAA